MNKIDIKLPHKFYPVLIGKEIFQNLFDLIEKHQLNKNLFFVIDKNVFSLYEEELKELFKAFKGKLNYFLIHATESKKSLSTVSKIYKELISNNYGRDSLLIALGGGITGDVAGFAAATYMRGIQLVQIPTTLLAAVDSSVGGKTGVNFNKSKNIVGSFYQPDLVLIDTKFFKTLPKREITCGVGEILKYAFISSKEFSSYFTENLENLFSLDEETIVNFISESIIDKSSVVEKDEKESGLRRVLNFGHTFAHAIESERNHKIKHGEAVIMGITAALFLSKKMDLISFDRLEKFLEIVEPLKGRIKARNINPADVYNFMNADKKNRSGKIKFVLLQDIGKILLDVEADQKDVIDSLEEAVKFLE